MGFKNDRTFLAVEDVKATFLQLLRWAGKVVKKTEQEESRCRVKTEQLRENQV